MPIPGNGPKKFMPPPVILVYISLALLLLATTIGSLLTVVFSNLRQAEDVFENQADLVYEHVYSIMQTNESILEGFAAFLDGVGSSNLKATRQYAQRMLTRHDHLYMMQVAQEVAGENVQKVVQDLQSQGLKDFSVRYFDFGSGFKPIKAIKGKRYFPIIFVAPVVSNVNINVGLDIYSLDFLKEAMSRAENTGSTITTEPFELIEGDIAYVMLSPAHYTAKKSAGMFALLVVKSSEMLPDLKYLDKKNSIILKPEEEAEVNLIEYHAGSSNGLFDHWLPRLTFSRLIETGAQNFKLSITRQLGLEDLDVSLLISILIGALAFASLVYSFFRMHKNQEVTQAVHTDQLFQLANFDTLTGLPNRNYFFDQAYHSLLSANRRGKPVYILYLDLNGFKKINDTLGHHMGDTVLVSVASRLNVTLRQDDIVARIGGDEFVVLLENIKNKEQLNSVIGKIQATVGSINHLGGSSVDLGVSVGSATFPDDGADIHQLLAKADSQMYDNKRQHYAEIKN